MKKYSVFDKDDVVYFVEADQMIVCDQHTIAFYTKEKLVAIVNLANVKVICEENAFGTN